METQQTSRPLTQINVRFERKPFLICWTKHASLKNSLLFLTTRSQGVGYIPKIAMPGFCETENNFKIVQLLLIHPVDKQNTDKKLGSGLNEL